MGFNVSGHHPPMAYETFSARKKRSQPYYAALFTERRDWARRTSNGKQTNEAGR